MVIRQLRLEEFEERMEISQFAFQFQLTQNDLEAQREAYRPDQEWGMFDEQEKLLSALMLIPFEAWIQGQKLKMGGIAGVATWPEARRQGCVSKLLVHALDAMRSNGQTISMLHPFSFPFYHRYGWEMTVERKQYTIKAHQLPPRIHTTGHVKRVTKPDIEILNTVYNQYASRYSGTLVRTMDWWQRKILTKPGMVALYTSEAGEAEGYICYEVANRKLTIHDWASVNETARTALWTYVGNHDSMIDEVILTAPMDDGLPFLLADPRIKQEVVPYFMSRIVDAAAFVSLYNWHPGEREEELLITLSDTHANWNNGSFRLVWSTEGKASLECLEQIAAIAVNEENSETHDNGGISCDIQTLTAMLIGNRKPSWLYEVGRIRGSAEKLALFERRLPSQVTYLMDFF
jgi:predicted acetyltransferase